MRSEVGPFVLSLLCFCSSVFGQAYLISSSMAGSLCSDGRRTLIRTASGYRSEISDLKQQLPTLLSCVLAVVVAMILRRKLICIQDATDN